MFEGRSICVVVPCHNEETQISKVLAGIPPYVTDICVIDDGSDDDTVMRVQQCRENDPRIHLIQHGTNRGLGVALTSGYKWARDRGSEACVTVGGDGQMNPADMPALLRPVLAGDFDYSKGNRLFHPRVSCMPRVRYFGSFALSLLTKISSGYWHLMDSQCGFTVLGRRALHRLDWDALHRRYGVGNDLLARLNVEDMRVCDVEVEPIYGVGERSGFRSRHMVWPLARLIVQGLLRRLREKYVVRQFHPLVMFYALSFVFGCVTLGLLAVGVTWWIGSHTIPEAVARWMLVCAGISLSSLAAAMWMDWNANRGLWRPVSDVSNGVDLREAAPRIRDRAV